MITSRPTLHLHTFWLQATQHYGQRDTPFIRTYLHLSRVNRESIWWRKNKINGGAPVTDCDFARRDRLVIIFWLNLHNLPIEWLTAQCTSKAQTFWDYGRRWARHCPALHYIWKCPELNKKPTNWLGQAKRRATKIRPKAVGCDIFGAVSFRIPINADRK